MTTYASYIIQTIDASDGHDLKFWVKCLSISSYPLTLKVVKHTSPNTEYYSETITETFDWVQRTIDLTGFYLSGNIDFKFILSGQDGVVLIDDIVFTASLEPVASFTCDVNSGAAPLTVQFTDTSTHTPTTWSWDFDDGSSPATTQNPSHEFETAGVYHVVLTAGNSEGSDVSPSTTITVIDLPVSSFTSTVGSNPLTITFTDTSTGVPSSWAWNFGDGDTSTDQNPEHTYSTPGYYHVTLVASNTEGTGSTGSGYVTASLTPPTAQVTGDSDPLNFTSAIVSKQITDACWKAEVNIPTEYTPPTSDDLPVITITVPDHTNTDQTIFYGVITNLQYTQTPAGITTKLICYDMAYYLVAQFVPIHSTTYSSSGSVYTPDQIVKRFLGTDTSATDWDHVTGIYPYNIDTVTGWGSSTSGSLATKGWTWANKTKKWQALVEICEYTDYMLYVYWKYNDPSTNAWCPVCYFVDSTDIDTGGPLDLPTKLTCTASTDPYLIGQITTTNQDDYKYNTVTIYGGVDANGDTLVGSSTAAGVGSTIKPIEYIEENEAWTSQTLVDDVASAYLSYLNTPGDVYQATFAKRTDLRLCQLIEIDGYNQIPEEDMRITGISYNILPGSNTVNVTFTTDRKFAAIRKLRKVVRPTLWTEISTMTDDKIAAIMAGQLVNITSASGDNYTFQFENGEYGNGRGPK